MTQSANLDLVRSIYEDWERGDFGSAAWADPEIEFVTVDGPEPSSGIGLPWLADAMRAWLSAWEDFHSEAEECRELDNERVIVLAAYSGRGKTSGLGVAQMRGKGAALFHVHGGKVTRLVVYIDRQRALTELWRESYEGWAGDS